MLPSIRRVFLLFQRAWYGVTMWTTLLYVGAISLVGIEAFEIVFGVTAAYPEMLPLVILVLGAAFYVWRFTHRKKLREAEASDSNGVTLDEVAQDASRPDHGA